MRMLTLSCPLIILPSLRVTLLPYLEVELRLSGTGIPATDGTTFVVPKVAAPYSPVLPDTQRRQLRDTFRDPLSWLWPSMRRLADAETKNSGGSPASSHIHPSPAS